MTIVDEGAFEAAIVIDFGDARGPLRFDLGQKDQRRARRQQESSRRKSQTQDRPAPKGSPWANREDRRLRRRLRARWIALILERRDWHLRQRLARDRIRIFGKLQAS